VGEKALHLRCPEPVRRGFAADVVEIAQAPLAIGLLGTVGVALRAEHLAPLVHAREAGMWATFRCSLMLTFHTFSYDITIGGNQPGKTPYMDSKQTRCPSLTITMTISGPSVHREGVIWQTTFR
jgi:hypothetical protein